MKLLTESCEASMPRRQNKGRRKSVYWWSNQIADFRRICLKLKICLEWRKTDNDDSPSNWAYCHAKKELTSAIKANKRQKWAEIQADVDRDTWGLGYQAVTGKLYRSRPVGKMDQIPPGNQLSESHPAGGIPTNHDRRTTRSSNYLGQC